MASIRKSKSKSKSKSPVTSKSISTQTTKVQIGCYKKNQKKKFCKINGKKIVHIQQDEHGNSVIDERFHILIAIIYNLEQKMLKRFETLDKRLNTIQKDLQAIKFAPPQASTEYLSAKRMFEKHCVMNDL